MTQLKYEYRATGRRTGKPRLLNKDNFDGLAGFRSLFGFDGPAVDYIESTGATRGIGRYSLYMDLLILDFDDNPEAQEKAKAWLDSNGYSYSTYTTGNRGQHIHIPIEPLHTVGLAPLVKNIVSSVFPGADTSIYKPTGVIRLPGTYHSKTGAKMCLLTKKSGKMMSLLEHKPKGFVPLPKYMEEQDPLQLEAWLIRDLHKYVGDGGRNNHLFNICATAIKLGHDYDTTEELAKMWNSNYADPPIRDGEFFATLRSAFRGV